MAPQLSNSAEASKIFAVMNALNLNPPRAGSNGLSEAPQQRRSRVKSIESETASDTFASAPVQARNPDPDQDRSRIPVPTAVRIRQPATRPWPDPPAAMPVASSTTSTDAAGSASAAPAGMRMAQGAPRIAALLQAHVAEKKKSDGDDTTSQSLQPSTNPYTTGFQAKAEGPRPAETAGNTAGAVDMDLFMERLSQHLEFE